MCNDSVAKFQFSNLQTYWVLRTIEVKFLVSRSVGQLAYQVTPDVEMSIPYEVSTFLKFSCCDRALRSGIEIQSATASQERVP